jgi:CheY-like chemotaxis protein
MTFEVITRLGVLVADPSAHMSALVAGMLRTLGRKDIREANDATRAMVELKRRPFNILIIDADLGGLDGVAFTRKLRADITCPNRLIPIIMMSAAPDANAIAEARDAGITEFLRKPFAATHLQSRIANITANPRDFVEAEAYKGPDRRRKAVDVGEKDRRETDKAPEIG